MGKDKDKDRDDSGSGSGDDSGSGSGSGSGSDSGGRDRGVKKNKDKKNKNKGDKDKKKNKGDKNKNNKGDKNKDKKGGKGSNKDKKGKKKKAGKKAGMSTGKKLAIGAGIAALAIGVGVGAGAFYLARRHKKAAAAGAPQASPGGVGSREIPSAVQNTCGDFLKHTDSNKIKTSNDIISIPDAVILGIGWTDAGGANLDLVAAVYNSDRSNAGYLHGNFNKSLFGDVITHTGDATAGSAGDVLGDNENIIIDLKRVPPQVQAITFGVIIAAGSSVGTDAYLHMLPLLREGDLTKQAGVKEIQNEEEAGHWVESGESNEDESDFIKLYHDDVTESGEFETKKGFVGGKIFRSTNSPTGWLFLPVRQPIPLDAQNGLWPALEHYANN